MTGPSHGIVSLIIFVPLILLGVEENISDCQELGIVKGRGMAWLSISSTREIFLVME